MSFPTLPAAPEAPARGQTSTVFNARMQAMMAYIEAFPDAWNNVAEAADEEVAAAITAVQDAAAAAFNAISTTSLAIGSGTKSFNATPGAAFIGGMEVLMSSMAAPGTNKMIGIVTSYNAETGAMVVQVPSGSFSGSGTYADWSIAPMVGQEALTVAVNAAIAGLLDGAPGALDTLNELAAALGDDANFAATVTATLALKANASALGTAAALNLASQAEAEAGSATNVVMTPQRVAQAIAALGAAGWTQYGSTLNLTSGSSFSFTNIPGTFGEFLVLIEGMSHNNGSATSILFDVSDNNSSWAAGFNPYWSGSTTQFANTMTLFGGVHVTAYAVAGRGIIFGTLDDISATRGFGGAGLRGSGFKLPGPVTAIRGVLGAGAFDAGTAKLLVRK